MHNMKDCIRRAIRDFALAETWKYVVYDSIGLNRTEAMGFEWRLGLSRIVSASPNRW
jgi:hypothetical protein